MDQVSRLEGLPQKEGSPETDPPQELDPTILLNSLTLYKGYHIYVCPRAGHLGTPRWVRPFCDLKELTVKVESVGEAGGGDPETGNGNSG